jgi:hypothetical protein
MQGLHVRQATSADVASIAKLCAGCFADAALELYPPGARRAANPNLPAGVADGVGLLYGPTLRCFPPKPLLLGWVGAASVVVRRLCGCESGGAERGGGGAIDGTLAALKDNPEARKWIASTLGQRTHAQVSAGLQKALQRKAQGAADARVGRSERRAAGE